MAEFKADKAAIRKLEQDLKKRMRGGVHVPTDGAESAAVGSVKAQLKKMGATPTDAEVRKIVREARRK